MFDASTNGSLVGVSQRAADQALRDVVALRLRSNAADRRGFANSRRRYFQPNIRQFGRVFMQVPPRRAARDGTEHRIALPIVLTALVTGPTVEHSITITDRAE